MEIIRAEGLRFAYEGQETPVLNDVSLSIQKGEWLTIVGHNGSGKSTFVKLLNGLFLPQEGRVVVDGMDTADEQRIWDIRKRVGMVFSKPGQPAGGHRRGGRRGLWPGKPGLSPAGDPA